jgi:hypothetical protein
MDFDETRLYYTHQQLQRHRGGAQQGGGGGGGDDDDDDENNNPTNGGADAEFGDGTVDDVAPDAIRRHFKEFLSKFLVLVLVFFDACNLI